MYGWELLETAKNYQQFYIIDTLLANFDKLLAKDFPF